MERDRTDPAEAVVETLISRGWCFRSPDLARQLVTSRERPTADAVESELLSSDLRSFGGKSLPDAAALRKSSHLQGPKVLQVVSAKDIYKSRIDASFHGSQHSRCLLRLVLTDGNGEAMAIEYSPIPLINEEIIPGSKIRLENKIAVHNGILCLNPKVVTILGGLVQSLFEEWELDRKYSGISRMALKQPHNAEGAGPPPFEKLRLNEHSSMVSQQQNLRGNHYADPDSSSKTLSPSTSEARKRPDLLDSQVQGKGRQLANLTSDNDGKSMASADDQNENCTSAGESRAKEVIEVMPVQNQAASQKLLQKMSQPSQESRYYRGNRHKGKDRQDEAPVFTLDEWEKRKTGASGTKFSDVKPDVSRDEELAQQLQRQLDMEDSHVQVGQHTEAERIRMNMFSFERAEEYTGGRGGSRGRGRGRGRGGRGRGRGRSFG